MTYEKVFEVFRSYLEEDTSTEILSTSRGYLVVYWESCFDTWVTTRLTQTPNEMVDVLRSRYEEYLGYRATNGYKREVTEQERQEIERRGAELADKC